MYAASPYHIVTLQTCNDRKKAYDHSFSQFNSTDTVASAIT